MKKILFLAIIAFLATSSLQAQINWVSIEEAEEMQQTSQKPIFIDFYTSWCSYCKKMDQTTLADPKVASIINENYIPVKFDAESKKGVIFKGVKYNFIKRGRKGEHAFAKKILAGQMAYPSYAILNTDGETTKKLLGYHDTKEFLSELK